MRRRGQSKDAMMREGEIEKKMKRKLEAGKLRLKRGCDY